MAEFELVCAMSIWKGAAMAELDILRTLSHVHEEKTPYLITHPNLP